jgi:hypothetical protein
MKQALPSAVAVADGEPQGGHQYFINIVGRLIYGQVMVGRAGQVMLPAQVVLLLWLPNFNHPVPVQEPEAVMQLH